MNPTSIEWVKNPDGTQGYTWNPITGCLNHVNGMCKGGNFPCYAYRLANGRLRERYLSRQTIPLGNEHLIAGGLTNPFYPRFWEDRLAPVGLTGGSKRPHSYGYLKCYKDHKPKGIFVCDMSDLFGIGIPEMWTSRVIATIEACPQHRFYLLTKQPQNLPQFSPYPDHCYVGITATNMRMLADACYTLKRVEAKVKYISLEPLLDFTRTTGLLAYNITTSLIDAGINWVIIGGRSGKDKFFPPEEWIKEIEDACDKARIPVFEKDNLHKVWYNYPRQEMPMESDYANSRRTQKG